MIEVVVAATILSLIALGAATFVPTAFRLNRDSRDITASTQTMNKILEEINQLKFDVIRPYPFTTEPVYDNVNHQPVIDTTTLNVSNPITICTQLLEGSTTTCASGKTRTFPETYTVNNTKYRIDLVVYKGKHVYIAKIPDQLADRYALASLPSLFLSKGVAPLSQLLMPPAEAAPAPNSCYPNSPSASVALGASRAFTGTNNVGGGYNTLRWTFGPSPGTVQSGDSTNYTWNQTGTFTVDLEAMKSNGSTVPCNGAPFSVTVYNPGVDFTVTPDSLSNFINVPFSFSVNTSQCPLCSDLNTTWDFGSPNPQTAIGMTGSKAYAQAGTYTVRLTVNTPFGSFYSTKNLTVGQSTVSITAPSNPDASVGQTVSFSGTCSNCGGSPIYTWDFGDSTTPQVGQTGSHSYNQVSSPTVMLSVKDGSITPSPVIGTATLVMNVTDTKDVSLSVSPSSGVAGPVNDAATTLFTYQTNSVGFSGSPNNVGNLPVTYKIWFGDTPFDLALPDAVLVDSDPSDSNFPSASHKYTTCGNYAVRVKAEVGLISSIKTTSVSVGGAASISASSTQVQEGSSVTFTANSQGAGSSPAYSWLFGDNNSTATGNSVSHVFATPGTFNVGLTATGGCNPSSSSSIVVTPGASSIASRQSVMKKVIVKVAPWSNAPPDDRDYVSSGVFLKAKND
ncbi:MAG: PKD domain-containing protein [Candidatus Sericytochromatia bacterium]|nr:PKD domain-containing protein [Candidatus Sericytochromatia bacterium]